MVDQLKDAGRLLAANLYASPRKVKELTKDEDVVRTIAFMLADKKKFHEQTFLSVAETMSGLLNQWCIPPVNLVPVPDSRGDTQRNLALCVLIRKQSSGTHVQDILEGIPRPSLCNQHQHDLPIPDIDCLKIKVRKAKRGQRMKNVVLVDNVITSGTTYLACRDAIMRTCEVVGMYNDVDILVWADARNTIHEVVRRV